MASLRTQSAAKLLRAAAPRPATLPLAQRRFQSDDASKALSKPVATEVRPANSPDYGVHIDKATSYVCLVHLRVSRRDRHLQPAQARGFPHVTVYWMQAVAIPLNEGGTNRIPGASLIEAGFYLEDYC